MCTLYENIITLCKSKGITGSKMCSDLGISRSILTGLKNGTKKSVSSETLQRFADYLGVTTDYLLGKETTENKKSPTPEGVELSPIKQEAWQILNSLSDEKLEKVLVILRAAAEM